MAYMSQEKKAEIAANLKALLAPLGIKYSLAVRHHTTLVLTIRSGPIDFFGNLAAKHMHTIPNHISVNPYWISNHWNGEVADLLTKIVRVMNDGNHDNSDIQTDYFDVGWYIDIQLGTWDKPYILTNQRVAA